MRFHKIKTFNYLPMGGTGNVHLDSDFRLLFRKNKWYHGGVLALNFIFKSTSCSAILPKMICLDINNNNVNSK